MTYKENITAILECYFTGFKKEIIDSACNRILEIEPIEVEATKLQMAYNQGFEDCRKAVMDLLSEAGKLSLLAMVADLASVNPQEPKIGHCKDCKYFEYDSVARVDGIPLIVAHEICSRWGDGCKTKEGGYCFLFEPRESEEVNGKERKSNIREV